MYSPQEEEVPQKQTEEEEKPGMTVRQMFAIWVCQLNEGMHVTLPYTLAVFMVRHFLKHPDGTSEGEQRVGIYTGVLAACFCAAQFLTQVVWGRVSDYVGRQPLLVMSNISSLASVVSFGLAPSYLLACLARLAGGLFNCTFVCVKTMIGEQCSPSQQTKPLVLLTLAWGMGTIMGPSIGTLSQPCDKTWAKGSHFCQPGALFSVRPFLLPCLVAAGVSFIALLNSAFVIRETLPHLVRRRAQKKSSRSLARIFTLSNMYDAHRGYRVLRSHRPGRGVQLARVGENGFRHDDDADLDADMDDVGDEGAPLLLSPPPRATPSTPPLRVSSPHTLNGVRTSPRHGLPEGFPQTLEGARPSPRHGLLEGFPQTLDAARPSPRHGLPEGSPRTLDVAHPSPRHGLPEGSPQALDIVHMSPRHGLPEGSPQTLDGTRTSPRHGLPEGFCGPESGEGPGRVGLRQGRFCGLDSAEGLWRPGFPDGVTQGSECAGNPRSQPGLAHGLTQGFECAEDPGRVPGFAHGVVRGPAGGASSMETPEGGAFSLETSEGGAFPLETPEGGAPSVETGAGARDETRASLREGFRGLDSARELGGPGISQEGVKGLHASTDQNREGPNPTSRHGDAGENPAGTDPHMGPNPTRWVIDWEEDPPGTYQDYDLPSGTGRVSDPSGEGANPSRASHPSSEGANPSRASHPSTPTRGVLVEVPSSVINRGHPSGSMPGQNPGKGLGFPGDPNGCGDPNASADPNGGAGSALSAEWVPTRGAGAGNGVDGEMWRAHDQGFKSPFEIDDVAGSGQSSPREGRPLLDRRGDWAEEPANKEGGGEDLPWWRMEQVVRTVCGYALCAFLYNLLDELVPIFASAPKGTGGLGLTVQQLALPLMTGGASLIVWALFGYPWLERLLGTMTACRIGIVGSIPLTVLLAVPSTLPAQTSTQVAVLTVVICVKNAMASNVFTSAMLTVNAAAPPKSIGAVNGAGQSLASIARAVGPALGGVLWSISVGIPFPGHQFLAFALVSASFLGLLRIYAKVQPPSSLNRKPPGNPSSAVGEV